MSMYPKGCPSPRC
uniref:Uncharacterized protein n=1 Tax=Arundo donax TaxID=35708 RepID=A0A0A9BHI8_ARUDO